MVDKMKEPLEIQRKKLLEAVEKDRETAIDRLFLLPESEVKGLFSDEKFFWEVCVAAKEFWEYIPQFLPKVLLEEPQFMLRLFSRYLSEYRFQGGVSTLNAVRSLEGVVTSKLLSLPKFTLPFCATYGKFLSKYDTLQRLLKRIPKEFWQDENNVALVYLSIGENSNLMAEIFPDFANVEKKESFLKGMKDEKKRIQNSRFCLSDNFQDVAIYTQDTNRFFQPSSEEEPKKMLTEDKNNTQLSEREKEKAKNK
jgi:hypothetical protein